MNEQSAHEHHRSGPFYHETKTADREIEQMLMREIDAAHPDVNQQNQIKLNANAEKIFEQKRHPVDDGRGLQKLKRRTEPGERGQRHIKGGLEDRGEGAD